eukprot:gnl/TRDRNA2_/TRDRNA2_176074_c0_seq1.p1 gnl/TRDRNA2_/TRDRNA2_176074_c0~~gnl/TRDRNA2_/TRDRNA2_176074_c0_seq1.p1  ORF type:complete len:280 (+),score=60.52 gnl/TRDRNA2_/TRDRNA2_176074_c0_seq1:136-975(+)
MGDATVQTNSALELGDGAWSTAFTQNPTTIHALVVYVDYGFEPAKSTGWCPAGFGDKLDTYENAMMFTQLMQDSGVTDITTICNQEATKENVLSAIQQTLAKCDENDMFIFFYSGHGAGMPDQDGDEVDGMDEAMCLPDADGNCSDQTWLRDDDFSQAVAQGTTGHKLIILDCCHSGTMLDFNKPIWQDQKALSMVGCKDAQESAGMAAGSRGGAFTKSLDAAVRQLQGDVSVGQVCNLTLAYAQQEFIPQGHNQNITFMCAAGFQADSMQWPLNPGAY